MHTNSTLESGHLAETTSAKHIEKQGLKVVERNFRSRRGEIDIVALDQDSLVFVEVRYRRSLNYGHPLETVDFRKQSKLVATAQYFLRKYPQYANRDCRFDVIALAGHPVRGQIEWIKNAFEPAV
jgi:putative endonuclease